MDSESVLTVVGGKVVYGVGDFARHGPPPLPVSPSWSPVGAYGGYHGGTPPPVVAHQSCAHAGGAPSHIWDEDPGFWGWSCPCFAF